MEERKRRVLQAIVDDYIRTGEPVGSRTVARKYPLGVSPATIRNEMADLEDMGYLEQPHTSAGRVPSDKGYRFYVDEFARVASEVDAAAIARMLATTTRRFETILRQAAHLLSEMTDYLAVASQPEPLGRVRTVKFVPVGEDTAVVLLVADDGTVQSRLVEFRHRPDPRDLAYLSQALAERLAGTALRDLRAVLPAAVSEVLGPYRDLASELAALVDAGDEQPRLLVDGAANLLKQPEFREVGKANRVLAALDRAELFEDRLGPRPVPGLALQVVIGREIKIEDMSECSLVTAVYAAPGGVVGRIGVLGPRRMDYARMIALVEGVANGVTAAFDGPRGFVRTYVDLTGVGGRSDAGEPGGRSAGRADAPKKSRRAALGDGAGEERRPRVRRQGGSADARRPG